ncbi:hypothetical protein BGZ79_001487 [Entomortierella chlamydospora]|nr:hypothetical protein BGZ79_001487 [Entomortierella chlamydospora]
MIDLFSALMTSIRVENHKIRFKSYPNTFLADDAVSKLGSLPSVRSVLAADPNDPTRVITQIVTTHLSFSRDMAKNICQSFMDARLIESATDPTKREFQPKALYQITPKGAHLLAKFIHRNKMSLEDTRHLTTNATASLIYLDRADDEDAIILGQDHVDIIFKRFAGLEPNVARANSSKDSSASSTVSGRERTPSATDLSNGVEVREQQFNGETFKDTFYGRVAVEWLLDYSTVISKEEAFCTCQEMVSAGYIEQVGEENVGGRSLFRSGNSAFYQLTLSGKVLAGWQVLDDGTSSISNEWTDDASIVGSNAERNNLDVSLLSTQFKLTSTNVSRLPISIKDQQRSVDESNVTGFQYNEEAARHSIRRLSQILNDPAFQNSASEGGTKSSYAASSSGRESAGANSGGGARIPTPSSSVQSTISNTSRLNGILSDPIVRDLFKSFLKQNICEENLSFYLEVMDYKVKFTALISSARAYDQSVFGQNLGNSKHTYPPSLRELEKQICMQAFAIFETYLVSGAPREVNLPHQMRQDITKYMQAVVRNMETPETNGSNENKNLPSALPSPRKPPTVAISNGKASNRGTGTQKELIHIALFDDIHDHIFRLMSTDSVPKFIKTDKYLEVVMSKHKRKNGSSVSSTGSSSPTLSNLDASGGLISNYPGNKGNKTSNSGGSRKNKGEDNTSTRNEDLLLRRSVSYGDHRQFDPVDSFDAQYGNYGGVAMDSRSKSAGMGQPSPRHMNGQTFTASPQFFKTPRVRTASSNSSVEAVQPSTSGTPVPVSSSKNKPNASGGSSVSRQAPASLMDIYMQQQQLQGYSNQRAQLSPCQVQQMYMVRNSRPSAASPLSSSSSTAGPVNSLSRPVNVITAPAHADNGTLNCTITSNQQVKSGDQKITVLFESTSLIVEDSKAAEVQQQQEEEKEERPYGATAVNAASETAQSVVWMAEMNDALPASYLNGRVNMDSNNGGMMYIDPAVMTANTMVPQPI